MSKSLIDEERTLRFSLWGALQDGGGPADVAPSLLQELRVYGGQRGIWVDKPRTSPISRDGAGVAVALLHTGYYDDELTDDDLVYHYPRTETPGWDSAQIAATKNASTLGIPVFVITASPASPSGKRVRLGWVQGWDDASAQFLVVFGEEPPGLPPLPADADPFVATQRLSNRVGSAKRRVGQARFRFDVLRRCGPRCAMCGIGVMQVLETPHVVPVADYGTNDPRNGMVMCATHHRAFDAYLFAIEPESLSIHFAPHGPSGSALHVGIAGLEDGASLPHADALAWRWHRWQKRVGV